MYFKGEGTKTDLAEAKKYFETAAARGNREAKIYLNRIASMEAHQQPPQAAGDGPDN
jgi:TPR repeat protein